MRIWQKLDNSPLKVGNYTLLILESGGIEVWRKTAPHTYTRDAYGEWKGGKLELTFSVKIHPRILELLEKGLVLRTK
jgi:hypothetical protein